MACAALLRLVTMNGTWLTNGTKLLIVSTVEYMTSFLMCRVTKLCSVRCVLLVDSLLMLSTDITRQLCLCVCPRTVFRRNLQKGSPVPSIIIFSAPACPEVSLSVTVSGMHLSPPVVVSIWLIPLRCMFFLLCTMWEITDPEILVLVVILKTAGRSSLVVLTSFLLLL